MFFDINKILCDSFPGLDPIKLLDYPMEDVIDLINGLAAYNSRQEKQEGKTRPTNGVIRRKAKDNWF